MSPLIWTGLVALAAAAVSAWLARNARTRIHSMRSTETLTVRDLRSLHQAAVQSAGEGQFRYQCEIVGAARPHKNGALKSELKKQSCVWHKHKITRKYETAANTSDGAHRARHTSSEVVSRSSTSTAYFVEDDTGKMVVRPGKGDITGAEKVLDDFDHHGVTRGGQIDVGPFSLGSRGSSTIGYKREEWLVRPGQRIYVHGEASDADGRLAIGAPADGGAFIMSTKSEEAVTRTERYKLLGFGAGAVVGVLGGIALLIAGALG